MNFFLKEEKKTRSPYFTCLYRSAWFIQKIVIVIFSICTFKNIDSNRDRPVTNKTWDLIFSEQPVSLEFYRVSQDENSGKIIFTKRKDIKLKKKLYKLSPINLHTIHSSKKIQKDEDYYCIWATNISHWTNRYQEFNIRDIIVYTSIFFLSK